MVRRVAEYKIRSTIRRIVINLLATKFFGGFLIQKTNRSKTMKSKIFIITGAVLCAITTGAHAVTKCVALNSSSTTCLSTTASHSVEHTDWEANCTTNGISTSISGIGICSSTDGGSTGATATELDLSETSDNNKYCWCKMTKPAVSRWVFDSVYASAGICAQRCTFYCATNVGSKSFMAAMFNSLSD